MPNVDEKVFEQYKEGQKGIIDEMKREISQLWDLANRAPKWCVAIISLLSGLLGLSVGLLGSMIVH